MDFWDLTKLLFRRWYVAVPLVLLSMAGTAWAALTIQPDYVATSYVQLVPPAVTPKQNDGKTATPRNPWLDLGVSSLGKAGILTVQDQKVVEQLKADGHSDTFTLTLDMTLPIVTFEVIAGDEEQATRSNEELVKRFTANVAALQADYGAAKDQSITVRQLVLGTNINESTSKVKRALVAIGGVGLLLSVALTVLVDAALRRRAQDKAAASADPTPAGADPAPADPAPAGRTPADVEATQIIRPPDNALHRSADADEPGGTTVVLPQEVWQAANGKDPRHR